MHKNIHTKKNSAHSKDTHPEEHHQDIIKAILKDHEPLKKLIHVLKMEGKSASELKPAFREFGPLLLAHAKAEDEVLYNFFKEETKSMILKGFKGEVEHGLAEQLLDEAKNTDDEDVWLAKVKVLAELVENHIQEEETHVFAELKKHSNTDERKELGAEYLEEKEHLQHHEEVMPVLSDEPATEYTRH